MLNETIEGLLGISAEISFWQIAAVVGFIAAIVGILWYFQDKILPKIAPFRFHKEDFKELFLYKESKNLQQSDFGIQHPSGTNKDVYKRKKSDDEIENYLKDSKDLLIIGMPKAGKTRSVYQAIKSVLPEFYVIKPPAEQLQDFIFPRFKKNYLIFFDDLNKFTDVNFDFKRFLDKFRSKSNRMIVISTCRSGNELGTVKSKSLEFFRRFEIVDLNNYPLSEAEGEQLAEDARVEWKPGQFNGTAGSVILDDEDMRRRYEQLDDYQKAILRTCKLLRSANIFTYKKDLIKNVCDHILETKINENNWIDSINGLGSNSFIINPERSFNGVDVYDSTLDSVVDDYSPDDHLPTLLALLIGLIDAENLFYLGNAFYEKEDYGNAEECYKKSSEFNPDYAAAHSNLGILLDDQERYDEAEKEYRDAIRVDPDYAAAHFNLGILLDDQERYDEAEKEYRDAIRVDPDYAAAHYNLGNLLNSRGRHDEAEKEWRDAIRADPDYAVAHSNLGNLLNSRGRSDEAEEEYRDAIRADPDLAEAHANLGILFLVTERPEEAKKEFGIAKELFTNQGRAEYVKKMDEDVKKIEELLSRT